MFLLRKKKDEKTGKRILPPPSGPAFARLQSKINTCNGTGWTKVANQTDGEAGRMMRYASGVSESNADRFRAHVADMCSATMQEMLRLPLELRSDDFLRRW